VAHTFRAIYERHFIVLGLRTKSGSGKVALLQGAADIEIEAALPGRGHMIHPGHLTQLHPQQNFGAIRLKLNLPARR